MKKLSAFISKYVFSDALPLQARMINMICLVGIAAALASTITRVVMRADIIVILIMCGIILSVCFLMFVCNRFRWYNLGGWVTAVLLGDILFPLSFMLQGGSGSGMAAFFVASIVVGFLLLRGVSMIVFLATHIALIVACYAVGFYLPHLTVSISPYRQFLDNVLSIVIAGLFNGLVILFQDRIYRQEKRKADAAGAGLVQRDKLLNVVNEAAAMLLSSDMGKFEEILGRSMEMMAKNLDVGRIKIWQNTVQNGDLYYTHAGSWLENSGYAGRDLPEERNEYAWRETLPNWQRLLSSGNCINGPLSSLAEEERRQFEGYGIKSLLAIPVFLQNLFWGFVSFDDCRRERVFTEAEESILRSGSLLLANALVRHEVMQSLVEAREEALQGAKAKSAFLANMSHEIRTPMNAIIGMTAIAKSTGDMEKKNSCLVKIEDASNHLLGVINDVLDMSKIEANKLELAFVSFNFEKMLQRVVNVINFRMDEKHQNFSVRIDRRIPRFIIGDDQRLAQVITNLLSNAVKFTPENGAVTLNTRLVQDDFNVCAIQVEVTDTGIGISEEQQARLFSSFSQADSNTSRKYGGTGLGLAISKRIVEMMGGRIWIESEPGRGSTFAFVIQAARDAAKKDDSGILDPGVNWSNVRVLCVDDDSYIREIFSDIATEAGFAFDTVSSGGEAVRAVEQEGSYDIYFIDWKMPGMNGIETTRKIREHCREKNLPMPAIILISSGDLGSIEAEARSAGVDKFLAKPIFPSNLTDIINQCLGKENLLAAEESLSEKADNFSGRRILLAEDVEINREIVQALLEPTSLIIDCAENGAEALGLFTAAPDSYGMIFMDVQMPEMDGYEATRKIRELERELAEKEWAPVPGGDQALRDPRAPVPIIAMTANVFREDIEKCLAAGMNGHVGKPLDFDEVLEKLRQYLAP